MLISRYLQQIATEAQTVYSALKSCRVTQVRQKPRGINDLRHGVSEMVVDTWFRSKCLAERLLMRSADRLPHAECAANSSRRDRRRGGFILDSVSALAGGTSVQVP